MPSKRLTLARVIFCLWAFVLAMAGAAQADHIVLVASDAEPYQQAAEAFSREMRTHGHAPKLLDLDDLQAKWPSERANGKSASSGKAALETLGLLEAQAIVVVGTEAAVWLQPRVAGAKPIVYCMVVDPQGANLVDRTNVYGVRASVPLPAQLELIRELTPTAKTIGVLYQQGEARSEQVVTELRRALPANWTLEAVGVSDTRSASKAIDELLAHPIDWVWTQPDAGVYNAATVRALLLATLRRKIPVFGFSVSFVRAGALLGVGVSPEAQGVEAALLTERLIQNQFRGVAAEPAKVEFALNRAAAEKLGIELAPSFLARARYVFGWDRP